MDHFQRCGGQPDVRRGGSRLAGRGVRGASSWGLQRPAGTHGSRVVASDPAAFERTVVRLTDHEEMPVLAKFSNETAAASPKGEHPLLVVQTYE